MQLAEDDKIRYKTEIKSWEDHMMEIGREDLIREQTLSIRKKTAAKRLAPKKATKAAKAKSVKKATATGKSGTSMKSSSKKTA